jgi:hypothetical protein
VFRWLQHLQDRAVVSLIYLQAGWNQLHILNRSKEAVTFFRLSIPAEHRWDPLRSLVEIFYRLLVRFGLLKKMAVVPAA